MLYRRKSGPILSLIKFYKKNHYPVNNDFEICEVSSSPPFRRFSTLFHKAVPGNLSNSIRIFRRIKLGQCKAGPLNFVSSFVYFIFVLLSPPVLLSVSPLWQKFRLEKNILKLLSLGLWNLVRAWSCMTSRLTSKVKVIGQDCQIKKNISISFDLEKCTAFFNILGTLLQVQQEKPKGGRGRLGSFTSSLKDPKKEMVRQCFLFTNHLLLTTRASNGRLHLAKVSPLKFKSAPGGGGGVSQERLRSQLAWQNLKGPLSCGMYRWKLYPFHTISIQFDFPHAHKKKWTLKRKHPFHTLYEVGRFNFKTPLSTRKIWTSWLSLSPPPPGVTSRSQVTMEHFWFGCSSLVDDYQKAS